MGDDLDLLVRHQIDVAQQFAALFGHHLRLFDDASMMRSMTTRCFVVGLASTVWNVVTTGMMRRAQQNDDIGSCLATENPELVLQRNDTY